MARTGFTRRWRVIRVIPPAAGADWTLQATGAATLRVVSLRAVLTTSAVVANRQVTLVADNTEDRWFQTAATAVQVNGTATSYSAYTGATPGGAAGGTLNLALPHAGLLLLPGFRLSVVTTAIDVGDQWSAIRALVDETPSDIPYIGDDGVQPYAGAEE